MLADGSDDAIALVPLQFTSTRVHLAIHHEQAFDRDRRGIGHPSTTITMSRWKLRPVNGPDPPPFRIGLANGDGVRHDNDGDWDYDVLGDRIDSRERR